MIQERYQELLKSGYDFDIGEILKESWDLFKEGAGSFIGYTLVLFIGCFVLMLVPIVGILSLPFVGLALMAGYYLYCESLKTRDAEFGDFFKGFSSILPLLGYVLLYMVLMIPYFIVYFTMIFPLDILIEIVSNGALLSDPMALNEEMTRAMTNRGSLFGLGYGLSIAYSFYISVSLYLALPLIINAKISPWKAIGMSRRVVWKKFLFFFGLNILVGILSGLGVVFTCGIGILVVIPYSVCISYTTYQKIFQPHVQAEKNLLDEFGQTDSDTNTEAEES